MGAAWQDFLRSQGVADGDGKPGDDALRAAVAGGAFGSLDELAVLAVSGADARTFLQGQLTCDVALDERTSVLGAWCNAKGRATVLFRLLAADGALHLLLPAAQIEEVARRLRLYVLRAAVTLRDASDELVVLWAAGDAPAAALEAELGPLPAAANAVAGDAAARVVRLDGPTTTHLVVAGAERATSLWRALARCAAPLGADGWQLNRVHAGEPAVIEATAGAFVPQMLNLELLGGISFTKGCYIGQEVVARTQHLGKLKRRMFRARVRDCPRPAPGDAIYEPSGTGTQSVGAVVRAAPSPDGGWELLAVVRIESAGRGELHLHQVGAVLEPVPLPYALEEERADSA